MAPVSLPILFGAIVAAGVVIDYGVKNTRSAFASSSTPTPPAPGGAVTATGSVGRAEQLAVGLEGTPYNMGGHANAIDSTLAAVRQLGTDCSGFVSDLLGPNGLGVWKTAYATPGIPSAPDIRPGPGQQVTLWNNPAPGASGHVFVEFTTAGIRRFFEDAGGIGAHEMTAAQAQQYLSTGQYQAFHPMGY